jgi:hypothetical protein
MYEMAKFAVTRRIIKIINPIILIRIIDAIDSPSS